MGKPPTTDQELQARVAALEMRADETDAAIATLDRRVTALEDLVTTGEPPPSGAHPDHELPRPPGRPDHTLPTPEPPDVPPPEPQPAGTARLTVTLGGQDFVYDEAGAVDVGDIVDPLADLLGIAPRFTMTCRRLTLEGSPLRVDFRRIEGWLCIIVAYGEYTTADLLNLAPYEAIISDGEGGEVPISLPAHALYSRWRWQSGAWPFPMTPLDDLYAAKLLPRYDGALTQGSDGYQGMPAAASEPLSYTPLGLGGFEARMSNTGGRGDIGPVTIWQGWYLCHPDDPRGLSDTLVGGEAGASFPWHYYDPATGAVIDPVVGHPNAGVYAAVHGADPQILMAPNRASVTAQISGPAGTVLSENQAGSLAWNFINSSDVPARQFRIPEGTTIPASGSVTLQVQGEDLLNEPPAEPFSVVLWDGTPTVGVSAAMVPGGFLYGSNMDIDTSHMPAAAYLPFLLTGDPYFLEVLQAQASFCVMESAGSPVHAGAPGENARSQGWSARTMAQCARVSPVSPPSWLQARSIWTTALSVWEPLWRADTIGHADPNRQAIRILGDGSNVYFQQWQNAIALDGLGWLALLHPDTAWIDDLNWLAGQFVQTLSDTDGWPQKMNGMDNIRYKDTGTSPLYASWADMWANNEAELEAIYAQPLPPAATLWTGAPDYLGQLCAALALAWQGGCTEITAGLTWLETTWAPYNASRATGRPAMYAIAGPTS